MDKMLTNVVLLNVYEPEIKGPVFWGIYYICAVC